MGRQNKSLGVGVIISVCAKSLERPWAKTKFPLTWQKEKLHNVHNLTVLTFAPELVKRHTRLKYSSMEVYGRLRALPLPSTSVVCEDIEMTVLDEDDSDENDSRTYNHH